MAKKSSLPDLPRSVQTALILRPPVVAVLGHVDHGKTSLLDYIRKTSVAAKEHGGITQAIGAYQVVVAPPTGNRKPKDGERLAVGGKRITFIDTPGHEAFAKMRYRGASAADIAILVVAADDSVMPQTKESIAQIRSANIPLIVAINKIDLEAANVNKVKQDLAKAGVQVEGFGGDVPWVGVSAKTGKGVAELLDTILLLWDLKDHPAEDNTSFAGTVIETRVDKGKGMVASIIVKRGVLKYASKLFEGDALLGKVRAMFDEFGEQLKEAPPGKPVQVLGFEKLPEVGAVLTEEQQASVAAPVAAAKPQVPFIPDFLKPLNEIEQKLTVLLKADTAGSLEAILAALPGKIDIVATGFGDIGDADILQAKSSAAFVVGFNVGIRSTAVKLAETEKVVYRTYTIIYELLDELKEVVLGMKEVVTGEREVGQGTILAQFPYEKQIIAGTKVTSGRLAKGDLVKIMRDEAEIGRARIKSIRQGKLEVTKVEVGTECGVLFDKQVAFSLNDGIIAYIK